jgi:hypothetical protein
MEAKSRGLENLHSKIKDPKDGGPWEGDDKTVFVKPDVNDRVVKRWKREIPRHDIEKIIYAGQIAHYLFPNHIPNYYESKDSPVSYEADRLSGKTGFGTKTFTLDEVLDLMRRLSEAGLFSDYSGHNFMRTTTGELMYLDDPWPNHTRMDLLLMAIESRQDSAEKTEALNWFEKLKKLVAEHPIIIE